MDTIEIDRIELVPVQRTNKVAARSKVPTGERFRYTLSRKGEWPDKTRRLLSGRCWFTVLGPRTARLEGRVTVAGSERAGNYDSDIEAAERAKKEHSGNAEDLLFDIRFDVQVDLEKAALGETIAVEIEASDRVEHWMKPLFRFRADAVRLIGDKDSFKSVSTAKIKITYDPNKDNPFGIESLTLKFEPPPKGGVG
jgi:hypothetical protein